MEERFEELLKIALKNKATDIHFLIKENTIQISIRGMKGLVEIASDYIDINLYNYLQYLARLDITSSTKPQSGSFQYFFEGIMYDFRFAVINNNQIKNGVLRILNCHKGLDYEELTYDENVINIFKNWINRKSGLIIFSGLTGSGKTTTLYSLLAKITDKAIYSLEDPIEVRQDNIIQIEINEKIGFGYDEGIKQLLRHNPDVLMIGEIRDENTAKMAFRAALTGVLVFTSLHAKSTTSAISRLLELGVNPDDFKESVIGVVNQRLFRLANKTGYTCVYDIMGEEDLDNYFKGYQYESKMEANVLKAMEKGIITDENPFR